MAWVTGMSQLVVQRPTPHVITVSTPRLGATVSGLFYVLFISVWYWLLLQKPNSVEAFLASLRQLPDRGLWLFLFSLAPLMAIPTVYDLANTAIRGRVYTLDGRSREIALNGATVARFDQVEAVQVRTVYRAKASNYYLLSLLLQGDRKVRLGQAGDREHVIAAADDVADELKVTVRSV